MDLKQVEKTATELLEKTGSSPPQVMLESSDGSITVMVLCFQNKDEKKQIMQKVRDYISENQIKKYYLVFESWMRSIDKDKQKTEPYIQPSQAYDRMESLLIQKYERDDDYKITSEMIVKPFERKTVKNKEKIVWLKKERMDSPDSHESIWNFFIEAEAQEEKMDKSLEKWDEDFLKNLSKEFTKKYFPRFQKAESEAEKDLIMVEMVQEMKEKKKETDKLKMYEGQK